MDEKEMMAVIEAIICCGDPVSVKDISELLNIDVTETEKFMDNMRAGLSRKRLQIIKVEDTYWLHVLNLWIILDNLQVLIRSKAFPGLVLKH